MLRREFSLSLSDGRGVIIKLTGLSVVLIVFGWFFHARSRNASMIIKGDGFTLELETRVHSLPGTFFMGVADASSLDTVPFRSHLLAVRSDGTIAFQRTFINESRLMAPVNFRTLADGRHAYLLAFRQNLGIPGLFRVLDAGFRDVFSRLDTDRDPELDAHDFAEAPDGHIFFLFGRNRLHELSYSTEIQEWDRRGKVVFVWSARDREKSARRPAGDQTPLEINSIDVEPSGDILVSFRDADEIVEIERGTGKVLMRLNSNEWKFEDDEFAGFRRQHCVRRLRNGNILMLDNGADPKRPARAVEYKLFPERRVAKLVWEYRDPRRNIYLVWGGSVQRLDNGNTVIGWGTPGWGTPGPKFDAKDIRPLFSEVDQDGRIVRELRPLSPALASYRVFFAP
jgi:hypothetical protein